MSLSTSELSFRVGKFEREAKERAVRETEKKLREQRRKERQLQKQLEYEKQQREVRAAQEAAEEQRQLQIDAEIAHNRGIRCSAQLSATPLDEQAVEARGIKRRLDKLVLPASMSVELMRQNAPKNGTMLFEIQSGESVTHAGVLEFSAPEGVVMLPKKVVNCLWGPEGEAVGQQIQVNYKYLPKGSYVQFQPTVASFQKEVGDEISNVLEQTLASYCTLTQGDIIHAEHNEQVYELKVLQLQPDSAVSIIDTEMEADIQPSVEYEDKLREQEELKRQKELELQRLKEAEEFRKKQLEEEQIRKQQEKQIRAQQASQQLLPEALPSQENVQCMFRLPTGERIQRRFQKQIDVSQLFYFVDSIGLDIQYFNLVTQFPRQVLKRGMEGSLEQLGFSDKSYVFFVEYVQQ
eukprot:TRINITY_DN24622_c0_g1_i3.p1 TRINITY_DN24622_c0_g1~~TRINITY_DN24622_c0_g1_i3.p1  ORF type:complete len:407 (+),score=68.53 TRINITY_DN24622_c0_g1_i3:133-1353(+)